MSQAIEESRSRDPGGVSLSDRVFRQISDLIIYGDIAPGEPLREVHLAGRLGTSRVPVREAIQRLAEEGWVIRRPRSSARVRIPTLTDIDEVFDLRALLETDAVRRAARYISLADIEGLRDVVDSARSAADADDQRAVIEANRRFHGTIAGLARNGLLLQVLSQLDRRVQWLFGSVAQLRVTHSLLEHASILDALEARDVEAATAAARGHVEATRRALHEHWQRTRPEDAPAD